MSYLIHQNLEEHLHTYRKLSKDGKKRERKPLRLGYKEGVVRRRSLDQRTGNPCRKDLLKQLEKDTQKEKNKKHDKTRLDFVHLLGY